MDSFNPDAYLQTKESPPPAQSQTAAVDPLQVAQFDPDAYLSQNNIARATALQDQYGSAPQQILAGIEAVGRGASLGSSDYLAAKLSSPEAVRARQEANPYTSFLGNVGGSGILAGATGGFGGLAPAIESSVGGLAGRALGTAAEGAIFGAGNVVSDEALGDPNLNAQKILADVGMGAAIGGGLGVLSKTIASLPAMIRNAKAPEALEGASEATPVVDVAGKKPTSLAEMQKAVQQAKEFGGQTNITELPQLSEAQQATERLKNLQQFPVTDMQLDSLKSQDARNEFKTLVEVPGKNGEILRNYQGAQKKDLLGILDRGIDEEIAPGYHPTTDAVEAGERAAQAFTDQIESTRAELKPAFEAIKNTPVSEIDHLPGVIDYLTNPESSPYANPKISNMFDTGGDSIEIKPYSTSMGIDQATYRSVKQAVNALEENPENFEKLFDIRKGLSQNIDVTKLGDAPREIGSAKAALMDYIQDMVQKVNPDQEVRDTFKKWAVNEQNAQMIEKRFGAEIGSNNWRSLAKGGDESILKKIFRDSDSVAAAKAILPPEDFNQMLADHLSILRKDATDKGVFSSNKFYSQLKRQQYALNEAFSDHAPTFQKMQDTLTLLRIFADDTPINPSGTTKTFIQSLLQGGIDPFKHIANLVEYGKGKIEEQVRANEINAKLAGQSDAAKKLSSLQGRLKKVTSDITSGVKQALETPSVRGAALGAGAVLSDKEFDQISKKLNNFYSNPASMMQDFASNTEGLYHAAPNITQGIQTSMAQAVQFLQSKLPKPQTHFPLAPEWQPTLTQKSQFSQYYHAVNDPLTALKQVKSGVLSNETMEALNVTHPHLLQEMRQKMMGTMKLDQVKTLPYGQRLSLSKFLGQPLDANMTPQGIQSNQMSFNQPRLSNQSAAQTGKKAPLGGLKQLNFSKRAKLGSSMDEI